MEAAQRSEFANGEVLEAPHGAGTAAVDVAADDVPQEWAAVAAEVAFVLELVSLQRTSKQGSSVASMEPGAQSWAWP